MGLAWGIANGADAAPNKIVLQSPAWLGALNLDAGQLEAIRQAVESALTAPVDAEQQCGPENGLCVARTAREWAAGNARYREIVVNVHTVGHAQQTVKQIDGQWPEVVVQ
jgi:hypothetical protein